MIASCPQIGAPCTLWSSRRIPDAFAITCVGITGYNAPHPLLGRYAETSSDRG